MTDDLDQQIKDTAERESMSIPVLLRQLIIDGLKSYSQGMKHEPTCRHGG